MNWWKVAPSPRLHFSCPVLAYSSTFSLWGHCCYAPLFSLLSPGSFLWSVLNRVAREILFKYVISLLHLCWFPVLLRVKAQVLCMTYRPCMAAVFSPCWSYRCSLNMLRSLLRGSLCTLLLLSLPQVAAQLTLLSFRCFGQISPQREKSVSTMYKLTLSLFLSFILLDVSVHNVLIVCLSLCKLHDSRQLFPFLFTAESLHQNTVSVNEYLLIY